MFKFTVVMRTLQDSSNIPHVLVFHTIRYMKVKRASSEVAAESGCEVGSAHTRPLDLSLREHDK